MLVHHLRRRPNFKTAMIQRLHGSYVIAGVRLRPPWISEGITPPPPMTLFSESWTLSAA